MKSIQLCLNLEKIKKIKKKGKKKNKIFILGILQNMTYKKFMMALNIHWFLNTKVVMELHMVFIKGFIGMKTMSHSVVIPILKFKVPMDQENMLVLGWIKHQSHNKVNFQFQKEMIRNKKVLVLHHILVSVVLRSILMEEINSNVKIGFYQQKKSNKNQIITTFYFTRTKVVACVLNTKATNFVTAMVHQRRTPKRNIFQVQASTKPSVA